MRAIQPNPSHDMLLKLSQRSFMPKRKERYRSVSEIGPPLNVDDDADAADDDGHGTSQHLKISATWHSGTKKIVVWDQILIPNCHFC